MNNKPYPYDLDLKNIKNVNKVQLKYRCPSCKTDLSEYKEKEKFCHNCGQKINWGVTLNINKNMLLQYLQFVSFEEKVAFFNVINQMNNSCNITSPCFCNAFNNKTQKSWDKSFERALKKCKEIQEEKKNAV